MEPMERSSLWQFFFGSPSLDYISDPNKRHLENPRNVNHDDT